MYIKNKLGISDEAVAALADGVAYLATTNPIAAAASVREWGISEAQGGAHKPGSAASAMSPQAAPQQAQGMHRAAFALQALPTASGPAQGGAQAC